MLFVVLLVARAVVDDGDEAVVTGTTTTVEETTTSLGSTSTTTTTTTAKPTTTTTTTTAKPTTTSTTQTPKPVVDGRGAVLVPPATSSRREMQPQVGCKSLADPGWTAECGTFTGKGGAELAWLVEEQASARRAYVLRRAQGKQWNVVLEARDDDGTRFAAIVVRVLDLSGDGAAEAAFGFRRQGSGDVLAVDVVEGPGSVVVHRELRQGSARVSPGQLDTWDACCAGQHEHQTIRYTQGAWRIVASVKEPSSSVPPSQL